MTTDEVPRTAGAAERGVSIVLPAFNAAEAIVDTLTALRQELAPLVPHLEFIVVDDGSTDATADIVTEWRRTASDVRLLRNRRNLGKGLSVYLGILAARHPYVCFTDADLPFAPGSYARVLSRLLGGPRMVVASRRMPDSEILVRMEVLGYAARRHLVGIAFNHLVRASLGLPFRDTQCGLKGFERALGITLLQRIRSLRFLFDIELLIAARDLGIAVEEVPVRMTYNDFKSSVKLATESTRMLVGLGAIAWRARRGVYRVPNPALAPEQVREWADEVSRPQTASAVEVSAGTTVGVR